MMTLMTYEYLKFYRINQYLFHKHTSKAHETERSNMIMKIEHKISYDYK